MTVAGPYPEGSGPPPSGPEPDWQHIADAVWFAAVVRPGAAEAAPVPPGPEPGRGHLAGEPGPTAGGAGGDKPVPPPEPPSAGSPLSPAGALPAPEATRIDDTGDVTLPAALPGGRMLARALKPFQRRIASATEEELDEEATAEYGAETGVWLPRYRPVQDRWLGLTLILDDTPSMAVWRPTATAFRVLLERHGAFRAVRTFLLSGGDGEPPRLRGPTGGTHSPAELLDPARRQVFLVLTDGISPLWRQAGVERLLRLWGGSGPLAIVNPYPQTRWRHGNLTPRRCRLRSPRPAAPNAALQVHPEELPNPFDPPAPAGSLAIPVVELSHRYLRWWATLVTGPPVWTDSLVHLVDPGTPPPREPRPRPGAATAVQDFKRLGSAQAFRLATLLAAAPLELPLLHRLQRTLLPESAPLHLAELLTSSLLHPTNDAGTAFQFDPGVRETLLGCATREDSARVLRAIAAHQRHPGSAGLALARVLDAPESAPQPSVTAENLELSRVGLAVFNALSGPYAVRARRLRADITAADPEPPVTGGTLPGSDPDGGVRPEKDGVFMPLHPEHRDEPARAAVPGPFPDPTEQPPLSGGGSAESLDDLLGIGIQSPEGDTERIWGNVPTQNPVFTGREALLEQLERRLRTQSVAAVLPQALHGEGGVGKSQIAIEYAYRHRTDYDLIWWVPSERPAQILASLIDLGNRLGLEIGNEVTTAVPRVRAALREPQPGYRNWLLVFDNAETPETVNRYFPEAGTGKVLITSRNQEWSQLAESLEVDVFTRQESVGLLQLRNAELSQPDADRLAEALGDLPLAIEHASAWLAATGMAVDEYLRLLDRKRTELTEPDIVAGYEFPVAAAAHVALDRLAVENPAALQMLQVCSFFAPEPIDNSLFEGVRSTGTPEAAELDETLQDPSRLDQAVRDIQKYVLARVDHRAKSLQLHRLVRQVLRESIPADRRGAMEHIAHILLAGGQPGDPGDSDQWLRYQALAAHVTAANALTCEDDWARALVLKLMRFYYYWGDYGSGRDLAREVHADWSERLGTGHPQTLEAAKWLGYYLWIEGDFPAAERIWRGTLDTYRATVNVSDAGTIDAMNMVAIGLRTSGRFVAARDLDSEALQLARLSIGPDDPAALRAAHNLGISLRLTGEFNAARKLDADTYKRRVTVLGDDHPETLRTLNNLTIDVRECGEYIHSRRVVERNYNRYVRLFGVEHQETIRIARNLAVARRRAGDHAKAYELAEDTMNRFRDRFGAAHPDAIAAALDFAVDVRESGDLTRAHRLAAETAEAYRSALGAEHPYTLYARTNLGIVLRLMGRTAESLAHNRTARDVLGQVLGPDHTLSITCGINLASSHAANGEHQAAHDLDEDMLRRARSSMGAEHPSTLACALNLAFDLTALGRETESRAVYAGTIETYVKVLGADHPAIAAARDGARANCDVDPMQF